MKDKAGLKYLIVATVFYLVFTLIELAMDKFTGIHWTSPRYLNNILGMIVLGILWIYYFVDKFRKK